MSSVAELTFWTVNITCGLEVPSPDSLSSYERSMQLAGLREMKIMFNARKATEKKNVGFIVFTI